MLQSIKIAPPNSMIFLSDPEFEVVPEIDDRSPTIWTTASCIAIGCLMFQDGDSDFRLLSGKGVDKELASILSSHDQLKLVFDGSIDSPNRSLSMSTSDGDVLLRAEVATTSTKIRIWTNHPIEPEMVVIVLE
jgi:hypothetical protein